MRKSQTCCTPSEFPSQSHWEHAIQLRQNQSWAHTSKRKSQRAVGNLLLSGIITPELTAKQFQNICTAVIVHTDMAEHTHTHIHKAAVSHSTKLVEMLRMSSHSASLLSQKHPVLCLKLPLSIRTIDQICAFIWRRKVKQERWLSQQTTTKFVCNKLPLNVSVLAHLLLNGLLESLTDTQTACVSSTWHTRKCIQQLHINTHYIPMTSPDLQKSPESWSVYLTSAYLVALLDSFKTILLCKCVVWDTCWCNQKNCAFWFAQENAAVTNHCNLKSNYDTTSALLRWEVDHSCQNPLRADQPEN